MASIPPVSKIDLAYQDVSLMDLLDQNGIVIESKNAYTKSEVLEILQVIENKLIRELYQSYR